MKFVRLLNENQTQEFYNYLKEGPCFVKFFSPLCFYCNQMKAEWDALQHRVDNKYDIRVIAVQSNVLNNLDDSIKSEVQGFPTIMKIDKNGINKILFRDERTTIAFLNFIKNNFNKKEKKTRTKYSKRKNMTLKRRKRKNVSAKHHKRKKTLSKFKKQKTKKRKGTPYPKK